MISEKTSTGTKQIVKCVVCGARCDSRASLRCPECNYPILHFTYDSAAVSPVINRRKEAYRVDASKKYQNEVFIKLKELIQLTAEAPNMANLDNAPSYLKTGEMSRELDEVWIHLVEDRRSDPKPRKTQTQTNNQRTDQSGKVKRDRIARNENIRPGQTISMGRFNNKVLKWVILEKENNKILVICDDVIEWLPFNNVRNKTVTWKDCTLRIWLNSDFYLTAFSEKEKKAIEYSVVENQAIGDTNRDTIDCVFLLSYHEMLKYKNIPDVSMDWHLRSLASYGKNHYITDSLMIFGDFTESRGVRPAMWLNLNSLKLRK